jgi:hypothetical protein
MSPIFEVLIEKCQLKLYWGIFWMCDSLFSWWFSHKFLSIYLRLSRTLECFKCWKSQIPVAPIFVSYHVWNFWLFCLSLTFPPWMECRFLSFWNRITTASLNVCLLAAQRTTLQSKLKSITHSWVPYISCCSPEPFLEARVNIVTNLLRT